MSVKPIREYHGKAMIFRNLGQPEDYLGALVTPDIINKEKGYDWDGLVKANPWLLEKPLVVKPDQLIKRRGKAGLIKVNCNFEECKKWIQERMLQECVVEGVTGILTHFLIEPFLPHKAEDEYYV